METKSELETMVENHLKELAAKKTAGSFVDIPYKDSAEFQAVRAAIAKYSYRHIRKPLGNKNGTFKMSYLVNPGHFRVTLAKDMP
jgi:hypothetical protein